MFFCVENEDNKQSSPPEEPPKKRSKLLGSVDIDSEEFKKFMKDKSKHTGALAEVSTPHMFVQTKYTVKPHLSAPHLSEHMIGNQVGLYIERK